MSNGDPNLPDQVTQRDIDATAGDTVDPNQCEHWKVSCKECQWTMEDKDKRIQELENQLCDQSLDLQLAKEPCPECPAREAEFKELAAKCERMRDALNDAQLYLGLIENYVSVDLTVSRIPITMSPRVVVEIINEAIKG